MSKSILQRLIEASESARSRDRDYIVWSQSRGLHSTHSTERAASLHAQSIRSVLGIQAHAYRVPGESDHFDLSHEVIQ